MQYRDTDRLNHELPRIDSGRGHESRGLFLALRAPERRSSVLGEAAHDPAATLGVAFLAFAAVDLKRVLEKDEVARGLAMISQRLAAGLDGLIEHRVDRVHQPPRMI